MASPDTASMPNADDPPNPDHLAREAARREAEDLLAGFDRPGRTPKTPPVERDFVAYHLRKARSDPALRVAPRAGGKGGTVPLAPAVSGPDPRARRGATTFVLPRSRQLPRWLAWAVLFVVMPLAGSVVSYVLLTRTAPRPEAPPAPTAPPAARSAAEGPALPAPPVAASSPSAVVTAPAPTASAPRATPAPSASEGGRGDFVRHL